MDQLAIDMDATVPVVRPPDRWQGLGGGYGGRHATWVHPRLPGVAVRHCGHPTALRPYFVAGLPIQRKFYRLADAQAAAFEVAGAIAARAPHQLLAWQFAGLGPDHELMQLAIEYVERVAHGFTLNRRYTDDGRVEIQRVYIRYRFNDDSSPVPTAVLESHATQAPAFNANDWFSRQLYDRTQRNVSGRKLQ